MYADAKKIGLVRCVLIQNNSVHLRFVNISALDPFSQFANVPNLKIRALILFIQTLALYKSFTYLLIYLATAFHVKLNEMSRKLCSSFMAYLLSVSRHGQLKLSHRCY